MVADAVAGAFAGWGIPTADSIRAVRTATPEVDVIASGGLRDGVDVAKVIALGAALAGMAGPFLKAASVSTEAVLEHLDIVTDTLRVAMFACGAHNLADLATGDALVAVTPMAGT